MKPNTKGKLIVAVSILGALFGSILVTVFAFFDIRNYTSPYLFTIIIGLIGGVLGYYIWRKIYPFLKPFITQNGNPSSASTILIMTVIGFSITTANYLNVNLANKTTCENYKIIGKYRRESKYRQPEINTLLVDLPTKKETVICDYNLWKRKLVGQQINLCLFESPVGFDYIKINESY